VAHFLNQTFSDRVQQHVCSKTTDHCYWIQQKEWNLSHCECILQGQIPSVHFSPPTVGSWLTELSHYFCVGPRMSWASLLGMKTISDVLNRICMYFSPLAYQPWSEQITFSPKNKLLRSSHCFLRPATSSLSALFLIYILSLGRETKKPTTPIPNANESVFH